MKPPSSPLSPAPPNSSGAVEAHQAELAHPLHDVGREVVLAVPLRGVRRDLALGEVTDGPPELLVLAGQLETHGRHVGHANPIWLAVVNLDGQSQVSQMPVAGSAMKHRGQVMTGRSLAAGLRGVRAAAVRGVRARAAGAGGPATTPPSSGAEPAHR